MENTVDILNKEFSEVVAIIGSDNFLRGLIKTINKPDFVRNLSNAKLHAYIILAKRDVKQEYSMRQLLKELCPDAHYKFLPEIILDICGTLESRGDEMIEELVERAAL